MNKNTVFFVLVRLHQFIGNRIKLASPQKKYLFQILIEGSIVILWGFRNANITKKIDNVKINELSNTADDKQEDIDVVGDKTRQIIA